MKLLFRMQLRFRWWAGLFLLVVTFPFLGLSQNDGLSSSYDILQNDLSRIQVEAIRRLDFGDTLSEFYGLSTPSFGQFFYQYQNTNGYFNELTYGIVSGAVSGSGTTGLANLSQSHGFSNGWTEILNSLYYSLGSADVLLMEEALENAVFAGLVVVATYDSIFGPITDAELEAAQELLGSELIADRLDYIITITVGEVWSGRVDNLQIPLSWNEISTIPNLYDSLPEMPAKGGPVVDALIAYIAELQPAYALQDSLNEAGWTLAMLKLNSQIPDRENGGIRTFNPKDGAVSDFYSVGYAIQPSIAQIQLTLDDSTRLLEISLSYEGDDSVAVAAFLYNFPLKGDSQQVQFKLADTSWQLAGLRGASYRYFGLTSCLNQITKWDSSQGSGWFLPYAVTDANKNANMDKTGFKFAGEIAYTLVSPDSGGNIAWIRSLLVCKEIEKKLDFDVASEQLQSYLVEDGCSEIAQIMSAQIRSTYYSTVPIVGGFINSFVAPDTGQ